MWSMITCKAVNDRQVCPEGCLILLGLQVRLNFGSLVSNGNDVIFGHEKMVWTNFTSDWVSLFLRLLNEKNLLFSGDMTDMNRSVKELCQQYNTRTNQSLCMNTDWQPIWPGLKLFH